MQHSGPLLFVGALLFSFIFFAFFANSMNPFSTPRRGSSRLRRVKYFRYVSIALFFGLSLTILLFQYLAQPFLIAAVLGALFFAILILVPSIRYYEWELPFFSSSEDDDYTNETFDASEDEQLDDSSIQAEPEATNAVDVEASLVQMIDGAENETALPPKTAKAKHELSLVPDTASTPSELSIDLQERTSSEEYALEMEIAKATAHINDDLTEFDQSIAEAEFEAVHLSQTDNNDVAKPDFVTSEVKKPKPKATSEVGQGFDEPKIDSKIAALMNENKRLTVKQEKLVGQNAKLQLDLMRQKNDIRRSEAEKSQAIEVKDKAIRIAAMERKRRKITEIKARKIIMKLKQNAQQLEADTAE